MKKIIKITVIIKNTIIIIIAKNIKLKNLSREAINNNTMAEIIVERVPSNEMNDDKNSESTYFTIR
ncbi:hypothetical protein [Streptococcus suis]|uniref:hypothetical protein n=2 Tax=Streptococcus suis TaxID=1307 RepID=UPI0012908382|nr:hypothetical protein [Streptococcus suis]